MASVQVGAWAGLDGEYDVLPLSELGEGVGVGLGEIEGLGEGLDDGTGLELQPVSYDPSP